MIEEKTKKYEVIIDFESLFLVVDAKNEMEAKEKGFDKILNNEHLQNPNFYVGDCEEIKENEN